MPSFMHYSHYTIIALIVLLLTICNGSNTNNKRSEFVTVEKLEGGAVLIHFHFFQEERIVRSCDAAADSLRSFADSLTDISADSDPFCVTDFQSFPVSIAQMLLDSQVRIFLLILVDFSTLNILPSSSIY